MWTCSLINPAVVFSIPSWSWPSLSRVSLLWFWPPRTLWRTTASCAHEHSGLLNTLKICARCFFYQCVNNISVLPKLQALYLGLCLFLNLYWLPWCWGALDVLLVLLLLLDSCGTLSVFYVWTLPLFGFCRPHMFHNWWPESIMVISNPAGDLSFVSFSVARITTENCVAYSCSWPEGKSTLPIHANWEQWMIFVVTCAFVVVPANTFITVWRGRFLPLNFL